MHLGRFEIGRRRRKYYSVDMSAKYILYNELKRIHIIYAIYIRIHTFVVSTVNRHFPSVRRNTFTNPREKKKIVAYMCNSTLKRVCVCVFELNITECEHVFDLLLI